MSREERVRFSKPPVLVGLNNPWSSSPEHVLVPMSDRPGCTGSRILSLIQFAKSGYSIKQYKEDFPDRVNLDDVGSHLLNTFDEPRNFVLFGRVVANSIIPYRDEIDRMWRHLQETPPAFSIYMSSTMAASGKTLSHGVYIVPHPSGLNRWYNEDRNKRAVGMFLFGLVDIRNRVFR